MHIYKITYSFEQAIHSFSVMAEDQDIAIAMLEREHAGATLVMLEQVA
jgi:hypothetical protein